MTSPELGMAIRIIGHSGGEISQFKISDHRMEINYKQFSDGYPISIISKILLFIQ